MNLTQEIMEAHNLLALKQAMVKILERIEACKCDCQKPKKHEARTAA